MINLLIEKLDWFLHVCRFSLKTLMKELVPILLGLLLIDGASQLMVLIFLSLFRMVVVSSLHNCWFCLIAGLLLYSVGCSQILDDTLMDAAL